MKELDTSPRSIGKIRECCNYAVRSSKNYLTNADAAHRQMGGNGETQLRDMLQKDLTGFCDVVTEEPFRANQKAYVTSNMLTFLFMLLSAGLAILAYFFNDMIVIAAFVFAVLALFAFFGAFGEATRGVDVSNTYAARKPEKEVRHRVILEANLDAPEKRRMSRKGELALRAVNLIGILLYLAMDILILLVDNGTVNFKGDSNLLVVSFVLALFIFVPLALTRAIVTSASTPGAADNLIGAYAACGALRYMSEMDVRMDHTEVCVLLTSAKDDRSRGARTFTKEFAKELNETDTIVLCLDSLYNPDTFNVMTKGRKVDKLLAQAAVNGDVMVTDHQPKYHKGEYLAFGKAGVAAASLTTLPDTPPAFYRAAGDNADNLNVHAVEAAIRLCLETAYLKDAAKK